MKTHFSTEDFTLNCGTNKTLVLDPAVWDDLKVESERFRAGATAPTSEAGLFGDAGLIATNFVHTQSDEVQFTLQFNHDWDTGTTISPHVHFTPFAALGAGTYAARFDLYYWWASLEGTFSSSAMVPLSATWSGEQQWKHMEAENPHLLTLAASSVSTMLCMRLIRNNTVANNFAGKLSVMEFDIHYQRNTLGSRQMTVK